MLRIKWFLDTPKNTHTYTHTYTNTFNHLYPRWCYRYRIIQPPFWMSLALSIFSWSVSFMFPSHAKAHRIFKVNIKKMPWIKSHFTCLCTTNVYLFSNGIWIQEYRLECKQYKICVLPFISEIDILQIKVTVCAFLIFLSLTSSPEEI
jgi:hypothetical protein